MPALNVFELPHQPGLSELLGQGLGQGISQGISSEISQQQDLQKAIALQKAKAAYPTTKETHSGAKIIADLVKKNIGEYPSQQDVTRGESILSKASEFSEQGFSPLKAYASAVNFINKQNEVKAELEGLSGPSFFGSSAKIKKDISIINKVKRTGLYNDDELAKELINKGYDVDDLDKFNLRVSPELQQEFGTQPSIEGPIPEKTSAPETPLNVSQQATRKRLTEADIDRFMEAANNDPDKAVQLALAEGYDIESE